MKKSILTNSKGGILSYTTGLTEKLANRGWDINVFFLTQPADTEHLIDSEHVHFKYLATTSGIPKLRTILYLLFRDRPSIIHINFALFGPLAILKTALLKIPFVYTLHGLPQPWLTSSLLSKIKYNAESLLINHVSSRASAVVTVSDFARRELKVLYDVDSKVIHNGVDANEFTPIDKSQSKKQLGCDEKDFVVLYVGKLSRYKDPLTLIKAFGMAAEARKSLFLIMIGRGELYSEVVRTIRRLNLSSRIKLLGHVSRLKLRLCYDAADLFVLPSVNEAFGIVLLEAMASGVPIIASDSGACQEVLEEAGVLFVQGDYSDLARKILELSGDVQMLRRLGNAGLKRVRAFSLESTASKYHRLYQKISGT